MLRCNVFDLDLSDVFDEFLSELSGDKALAEAKPAAPKQEIGLPDERTE